MPRIALSCAGFVVAAVATACTFDTNDVGAHFSCSDGVCPSGERCVAGTCTTATMSDASALDSAPAAALTCADPGVLTDGSGAGSTATRTSQVAAFCSGEIMNGPDAVYRVAVAASTQLHIAVTGDYAVTAYALAPCTAAPATPTCEGGVAAFTGAPIDIAVAAGDQFIVVDSVLPLGSGTYDVTITVGP